MKYKIIGISMLCTPFIVMFIHSVIECGILFTSLLFLSILALCGFIWLAIYLIDKGDKN